MLRQVLQRSVSIQGLTLILPIETSIKVENYFVRYANSESNSYWCLSRKDYNGTYLESLKISE